MLAHDTAGSIPKCSCPTLVGSLDTRGELCNRGLLAVVGGSPCEAGKKGKPVGQCEAGLPVDVVRLALFGSMNRRSCPMGMRQLLL